MLLCVEEMSLIKFISVETASKERRHEWRTLGELQDRDDKVVRYFLRLELRAVEQDWCSANNQNNHWVCSVVKLKA